MEAFRAYGPAPYQTIVLHGGPGAPGSCAGICEGLSSSNSVLEHLQHGHTIEALMDEILLLLRGHAPPPAVLIGHSWGAWLGCLFAAAYPNQVRKLILVGCAPFESSYVASIQKVREAKLSRQEATALQRTFAQMNAPDAPSKSVAEAALQLPHTDDYDLLPGLKPELIRFDEAQYKALWTTASAMRADGLLLDTISAIRCPVLAIHGKEDPHPYEGVRGPLSKHVKDFTMVLLDRCGHSPWREQYAHEAFFQILRGAIHA